MTDTHHFATYFGVVASEILSGQLDLDECQNCLNFFVISVVILSSPIKHTVVHGLCVQWLQSRKQPFLLFLQY